METTIDTVPALDLKTTEPERTTPEDREVMGVSPSDAASALWMVWETERTIIGIINN
jgi:hypothetical protein